MGIRLGVKLGWQIFDASVDTAISDVGGRTKTNILYTYTDMNMCPPAPRATRLELGKLGGAEWKQAKQKRGQPNFRIEI